jgi:GNAT superfamily N-acetyltransferase
MDFRIAAESDLDELAQMRWDFRLEESPGTPVHDRQSFLQACTAFLRQGLASQRWVYWVAVCDGAIVSHVFVQRIDKVPKPNRLDDGFGYVTNVYTRPAHRGRGIGSELMARVIAWAQAQDLECLLVGPSDASVRFYERVGFRWNEDLMGYTLRPYVL